MWMQTSCNRNASKSFECTMLIHMSKRVHTKNKCRALLSVVSARVSHVPSDPSASRRCEAYLSDLSQAEKCCWPPPSARTSGKACGVVLSCLRLQSEDSWLQ